MGAKAKNDLAPLVRTAFIRAIGLKAEEEHNVDTEETRDKTFSQLMKEAIDSQGILAVLDRLSKYTVREASISGKVDHDHKHKHTHEAVSETAQWIDEMLGEHKTDKTKKPSTH